MIVNDRLTDTGPSLLALCQEIYELLAKWELDTCFYQNNRGALHELERIEVKLENEILNAGGELPDQG